MIQNLALTLQYIIEEESFFGALARTTRLQQPRRKSTLVNILVWVESKVDNIYATYESHDQDLRLAAESYIRNAIVATWELFDSSVHSVFDRIECKKTAEPPIRKSSGMIDASIPTSKCSNRECRNANVVRENLQLLIEIAARLNAVKADSPGLWTDELEEILAGLALAIKSPGSPYNYKRCLHIGDLWIHLEAILGGIKHFATTNYKESQVLCPVLGLEMKSP